MQDLFASQAESNLLWQNRYPMRPHASGLGHVIEIPDGELYLAPGFLSSAQSDQLTEKLLANDRHPVNGAHWQQADLESVTWQTIAWRQDRLHMYGREVAQPRLSAWYGDNDHSYTYSGITLQPLPWKQPLIWLRTRLQQHAGLRFNSVLLNWYRSGEDHVSWHADAEPELGLNPTIASITLGATRRFLLRRQKRQEEKIELPLAHGTLLIMSGALQHHWQHSVPRQRRVQNSRINLTFRMVESMAFR